MSELLSFFCGKEEECRQCDEYAPRMAICASAVCGKRFHSPCPSQVFCNDACLGEFKRLAEWEEKLKTAPEREKSKPDAKKRGRPKLSPEEKKRRVKQSRDDYRASDKGRHTKNAWDRRYRQRQKEKKRAAKLKEAGMRG